MACVRLELISWLERLDLPDGVTLSDGISHIEDEASQRHQRLRSAGVSPDRVLGYRLGIVGGWGVVVRHCLPLVVHVLDRGDFAVGRNGLK